MRRVIFRLRHTSKLREHCISPSTFTEHFLCVSSCAHCQCSPSRKFQVGGETDKQTAITVGIACPVTSMDAQDPPGPVPNFATQSTGSTYQQSSRFPTPQKYMSVDSNLKHKSKSLLEERLHFWDFFYFSFSLKLFQFLNVCRITIIFHLPVLGASKNLNPASCGA